MNLSIFHPRPIQAWLSILAFGAVWGCGSKNEDLPLSHITSINSVFEPRIGESYNEYTDTYMTQSCIRYDLDHLEFIPPQIGSLIYTQNASFEQITDTMNGGGEIHLDLSAVKADGKVRFANEMQSSKYSTSVMISLNVNGGEVALPQQVRSNGSITRF